MPETAEQPTAIRARAYIGSSKWLHRPVRLVRYDALWPDGRVEPDVDVWEVMYRGRHTTDSAVIQQKVRASCPPVGTGRWVHQSGTFIEGPVEAEPRLP